MKGEGKTLDRVREARTPDELRELLFVWPGRIDEIAEEICRHGRTFDIALVQTLLAIGAGIVDLVKNPAFPRETADEGVALWYAHRIQSEDTRGDAILRILATTVLEILFRDRRISIDSEAFRVLRRVVGKGKGRMTSRQYAAATSMLHHPDMPEDVLSVLYNRAEVSDEFLARILAHPNAPIEWAREQAGVISRWSFRNGRALCFVVSSERLRRDAVVRNAIRTAAVRSKDNEAAMLLASDGMEDCRELFRHLLDWNFGQQSLVRLLLERADRVRPHLTVADMAELLSHSDPSVRTAAIAALGGTDTAEQAPEHPAARRTLA